MGQNIDCMRYSRNQRGHILDASVVSLNTTSQFSIERRFELLRNTIRYLNIIILRPNNISSFQFQPCSLNKLEEGVGDHRTPLQLSVFKSEYSIGLQKCEPTKIEG